MQSRVAKSSWLQPEGTPSAEDASYMKIGKDEAHPPDSPSKTDSLIASIRNQREDSELGNRLKNGYVERSTSAPSEDTLGQWPVRSSFESYDLMSSCKTFGMNMCRKYSLLQHHHIASSKQYVGNVHDLSYCAAQLGFTPIAAMRANGITDQNLGDLPEFRNSVADLASFRICVLQWGSSSFL